MHSFFQLLKKNGSILIIGLLIGLVGGFKLANAKFRSAQVAELDAQAVKAAANLGKAPAGQAGAAGMASQGGQNPNQVTDVLAKARANPNDFEAQIEAADQFLQIQRPEGALEFLERASKLKPNEPRAMTALSTSYLMLGKIAEAQEWARKALAQKPDDIGAKLLLALSLIEARQDLNEAEKLLTELEKVRPGDQMLVNARQSLNEVRSGSKPAAAGAPASTTLEHDPAKTNAKPGGAR